MALVLLSTFTFTKFVLNLKYGAIHISEQCAIWRLITLEYLGIIHSCNHCSFRLSSWRAKNKVPLTCADNHKRRFPKTTILKRGAPKDELKESKNGGVLSQNYRQFLITLHRETKHRFQLNLASNWLCTNVRCPFPGSILNVWISFCAWNVNPMFVQ